MEEKFPGMEKALVFLDSVSSKISRNSLKNILAAHVSVTSSCLALAIPNLGYDERKAKEFMELLSALVIENGWEGLKKITGENYRKDN